MPDKYTKGMATRRAVLGDTHVAKAEASKTHLDEPFQALITIYAGVPKANHALKLAKQTYKEMGVDL